MQSIHTDQAPAAIGPYSQAQRVGGFVFVSGQIPVDPASGAIPEGVEAQAEQVFRNLAAILRAAGTDISRTVKTTLFIQNMADFAAVNAIYARHFSEPYPARSCVEVAKLPRDVLLECEAIAAMGD
ncbi:MAG: RidA family protein [Oscillospiraceae bacterium]|nr:RidA family protein [Oscillospiraceae bacterium]